MKAVALFDRALSVCSYCAYPPLPQAPGTGVVEPLGGGAAAAGPQSVGGGAPLRVERHRRRGQDGRRAPRRRLPVGPLPRQPRRRPQGPPSPPPPSPSPIVHPSVGGRRLAAGRGRARGFCQESEAMKRYCGSRYRSDSSGSPSCVQACRVSANLLFMISLKLAILPIACKRVGNLPTTTMVGNPPPPRLPWFRPCAIKSGGGATQGFGWVPVSGGLSRSLPPRFRSRGGCRWRSTRWGRCGTSCPPTTST